MVDKCGTITICLLFAGVRPNSETCQVTENIAQYLNYFFTSVLKMNIESTPDCFPSISCNDVECVLPGGGYYKYSLMVCQTPPALRLLNVLPNGTTFFQHITNHSEVFTLPPVPEITLNITFERINPTTVGLMVIPLFHGRQLYYTLILSER